MNNRQSIAYFCRSAEEYQRDLNISEYQWEEQQKNEIENFIINDYTIANLEIIREEKPDRIIYH